MRLWLFAPLVWLSVTLVLVGFAYLPTALKPSTLRTACEAQKPDGTLLDRGRAICRE